MKKTILQLTQYLYIISLVVLLILYFFPGSLIGYLLYGSFDIQPDLITNPIGTSINHAFAFFYLSFLGFICSAEDKILTQRILFLLLISIFCELTHIFIPKRSFQYLDLFANFFGILLAIFIIVIYKKYKKTYNT